MSMETKDVPMSEIHFNQDFNCRDSIAITAAETIALANDIRSKGLIQPITLIPYTPEQSAFNHGKKYLLAAGYRRYVAHTIIGATTILSNIRTDLIGNMEFATIINFAENLQRKQLNMMEEARIVHRLLGLGWDRERIAKDIGVSVGWVQLREYMLKMPDEVQDLLSGGIINQGQLRKLYTVQCKTHSEEEVKKVAQAFAKANRTGTSPDVKIPVTKKQKSKFGSQKSKTEVQGMINLWVKTCGADIASRLLAWANGEVSDKVILDEIEKYAGDIGTVLVRPFEDDIISMAEL